MIRFSLAFLWIFTAMTSSVFAFDVGVDILIKGGVSKQYVASLIYMGSAVDLFVGLWLVWGKALKQIIYLQVLVILIFTALITVLVPQFWLHPFGPVTKNIPILVLCWVWYQQILLPIKA